MSHYGVVSMPKKLNETEYKCAILDVYNFGLYNGFTS